MFKGLETHSVLYILHHYTPLAALDPLEVVEILKHRPRVPALSVSITPPPQFSRGPTPLKAYEDASSPISATPGRRQLGGGGGKLKPEQERDISVFRSFWALKLVLDAVWAAVQISSGLVPDTKRGRRGEEEGDGRGGGGGGKREREAEKERKEQRETKKEGKKEERETKKEGKKEEEREAKKEGRRRELGM